MANLPTILISDIEIRQDAEGRFCLNDLHKASGGLKKHRPNYWLDLQQTADLIDELGDAVMSASPINVVRGNHSDGRVQGTFVVKELVYSYAMWISPKFHLHVIRTFDAVQSKSNSRTPPANLSVGEQFVAFGQALIEQEREIKAIQETQAKLVHAVKSEIKKRKKIEQRLDAIKTASKYFTIVGYVSYAWGYPDNRLPLKEAQAMGRKASKYCSEHDISIGQTNDERYGMINTYPLDILEQLFPFPNYKTSARKLKLQSSSRH
jgi:hypothetical protein